MIEKKLDFLNRLQVASQKTLVKKLIWEYYVNDDNKVCQIFTKINSVLANVNNSDVEKLYNIILQINSNNDFLDVISLCSKIDRELEILVANIKFMSFKNNWADKLFLEFKDALNNHNLMLDLNQILTKAQKLNEKLKEYKDVINIRKSDFLPYFEKHENRRSTILQYVETLKKQIIENYDEFTNIKEFAQVLKAQEFYKGKVKELSICKRSVESNFAKIETLVKSTANLYFNDYIKNSYSLLKKDFNTLLVKYKDRKLSYDYILENIKLIDVKSCELLLESEKLQEPIFALEKDISFESKLLGDGILYYNYSLLKKFERNVLKSGVQISIDESVIDMLLENIKLKLYDLTSDQFNAITKAISLLRSSLQTNCLIQGDVSSGKTIVSVVIMFAAALSGYKVAYLVPRTALKIQHYNTLMKYNELFGLNLNIKVDGKHVIKGDEDIVLNGYSFSNKTYKNINIDVAVIDEIQLLGVEQRSNIQKAYPLVELFYTTATPHPRTKVLTTLGNLDLIEIRNMPPNRISKITKSFEINNESFDYVKNHITEQVNNKQLVIVIAPYVNMHDIEFYNLTDMYKKYSEFFNSKRVCILHNKLSEKVIDNILEQCENGDIDILVTTKMIEVGIDLKRASTIIIHDKSGRFGVSTLHQLRGRVGRNGQQGYCFIEKFGNNLSSAQEIILKTEDVFEITKNDLLTRGIDKIIGVNQSSSNSSNANVQKKIDMYCKINEYVDKQISNLTHEQISLLRKVSENIKLSNVN